MSNKTLVLVNLALKEDTQSCCHQRFQKQLIKEQLKYSRKRVIKIKKYLKRNLPFYFRMCLESELENARENRKEARKSLKIVTELLNIRLNRINRSIF